MPSCYEGCLPKTTVCRSLWFRTGTGQAGATHYGCVTGSYTYTFEDIQNRPVAVIGAGTLGPRIAFMFASRRGTVRIYARRAEQLASATQYVTETPTKSVQDRGSGAAQRDHGPPGNPVGVGVATGTSSLQEALDGAWLALESVPEKLEIKIPLWGQIDQAAPPDTIFATNSASYPSRLMAEKVSRQNPFVQHAFLHGTGGQRARPDVRR